MNGTPEGALVVVASLAVVLAAALSAGEAAVLRLGRSGLTTIAAAGGAGTRRAARLLEDPYGTVAAAAWVRVHAEVLATVVVTVAVAGAGFGWAPTLVLATVVNAVLALVLVRYLPRTLGRGHPQGVVALSAGVLLLARALARPAGAVARDGTPHADPAADEIREMVDRVHESEPLEEEDREMFRSVLELGGTHVRAVMVPRTEMITLPAGAPVRKALSLFLRSGYSRVPVVGESVDDVVGVLYLKDLLRHRNADPGADEEPVDPLARPAVFVPESKAVDDLLRDMQRDASHIALVVDEYGGIAGLVTIEDALEEIVGELTDEHDRSGPEVEDLGDGLYRVPSRLPVDELGELFGLELDDDEVDTAGGLLAKALGKVPLAGSSAEVAGLVLTADRVEGRRRQVSTLLVRRAADRPGDVTVPADQGAGR
jgi:CBS domain containing-hemolysin-like protein